jgi:hypothetical protein
MRTWNRNRTAGVREKPPATKNLLELLGGFALCQFFDFRFSEKYLASGLPGEPDPRENALMLQRADGVQRYPAEHLRRLLSGDKDLVLGNGDRLRAEVYARTMFH